jgi:hypothetical protein
MDISPHNRVSPRYRLPAANSIEQTAILRDVELPEVHFRAGGQVRTVLAKYDWLLVLNQECDLRFDRLARSGEFLVDGGAPISKDKCLRSILLCPGFARDEVLAGTYTIGASDWHGNQKDMLLQNRHERFHLLPAEDPLTETLVFDFKLVVAVHPEYLQQWVDEHPQSVVAVLCPPYRDRLMQRFVNYFGRIAEPEDG